AVLSSAPRGAPRRRPGAIRRCVDVSHSFEGFSTPPRGRRSVAVPLAKRPRGQDHPIEGSSLERGGYLERAIALRAELTTTCVRGGGHASCGAHLTRTRWARGSHAPTR